MTFLTIPDPSVVNNVDLHQTPSRNGTMPQAPALPQGTPAFHTTSGEKAKARALLAAIRTLQAVAQAQRPATAEERVVLARFPGFGPVALGIFPDPVTGQYKDAGWQQMGDQLQALLGVGIEQQFQLGEDMPIDVIVLRRVRPAEPLRPRQMAQPH